jgi:N-glycosylase/DNA lyase
MKNFLAESKITINDYDDTWDNLLRKIKDSDFNKTSKFEVKLVQYFQTIVRIYLPKDILTTCLTPNQLIEYVGTTPFIIKLP